MKYGIIILSYWDELYQHFDTLNSILAYKNNIPFKIVYNHQEQLKSLLPHEMFFKSDIAYPKSLLTMLEKFIWSWNILKEQKEWQECDYIIRANSSTFLNHEILKKHIEKLPKQGCFSGHIIFNEFISGTCMIFTKDMLEFLTRQFTLNYNLRHIDHDDCVIRELLKPITKIDMDWYCLDKDIIPDNNELDIALKYPIIRIRNNKDRKKIDTHIWNELFQRTI